MSDGMKTGEIVTKGPGVGRGEPVIDNTKIDPKSVRLRVRLPDGTIKDMVPTDDSTRIVCLPAGADAEVLSEPVAAAWGIGRQVRVGDIVRDPSLLEPGMKVRRLGETVTLTSRLNNGWMDPWLHDEWVEKHGVTIVALPENEPAAAAPPVVTPGSKWRFHLGEVRAYGVRIMGMPPADEREEKVHAAARALREAATRSLDAEIAKVLSAPEPARDEAAIRIGDRFQHVGTGDWSVAPGDVQTVMGFKDDVDTIWFQETRRAVNMLTDALRDTANWKRLPRCADDCTPAKPCRELGCPDWREPANGLAELDAAHWARAQHGITDPPPREFAPPELRAEREWGCGLVRTKR